jgi:hypothetical protein
LNDFAVDVAGAATKAVRDVARRLVEHVHPRGEWLCAVVIAVGGDGIEV